VQSTRAYTDNGVCAIIALTITMNPQEELAEEKSQSTNSEERKQFTAQQEF
jgi:hypothetical protein